MKLRKLASGAFKDWNSLIAASGGLEAAVVKATSHDELSMDYASAQRIYRYIRTNPSSLNHLIRVISSRVESAHSWAVVLKALMLMHGLLRCRIPAVKSIGRLPFDLSSFSDAHSRLTRTWGFNRLVRAYFEFLDQRSVLFHDQNQIEESHVMMELSVIQKMQSLVDTLLQIKPVGANMRMDLVMDVMDCAIVELSDLYGRICREIGKILPNIHSKSGKIEAKTALKIAEKSISQAEGLVKYFEFYREFGVPNAQDIPDVVQIPYEEVVVLENILYGVSEMDEMEKTKLEVEDEKATAKETMESEKRLRFEEQSSPEAKERLPDSHHSLSTERDESPDLISF